MIPELIMIISLAGVALAAALLLSGMEKSKYLETLVKEINATI